MPHFVTEQDEDQRQRELKSVSKVNRISGHLFDSTADEDDITSRKRKQKVDPLGSGLRIGLLAGQRNDRAERKKNSCDGRSAKCR